MTNLLSPSISFSNWTVKISNFDCSGRLRTSFLKGCDQTDQIGLSRPKWTKMYQSGPNGPNSTEVDQMEWSDRIDRSGQEYTKLDRSGSNRPNWTEVDRINQSELNWTEQIEMDRIWPKQTKFWTVISKHNSKKL